MRIEESRRGSCAYYSRDYSSWLEPPSSVFSLGLLLYWDSVGHQSDTLIKGLTKELLSQPKRSCNLDQQCKAPDLLTFGDCGRTSVAEFVGRMTKTTREGKKVRVRGPRLASPPSIRLREEQSDFVSSTCSREPTKGDTSVDPTERPNSEFVVPSQQPTLILVVFAIAPEDPGRNFPNFRPAPPWKSKLLA